MPEFRRLCERTFFEEDDVVVMAQRMLGLYLVRRTNTRVWRLLITETEAYRGYDDRASHAANGRRTPRTEVFFREGGHAYVYLCYGVHWLFNIITNKAGHPDAVLIRGGILLNGENGYPVPLTGPGKVTKTLEITGVHNALDLTSSDEIWLEQGPDLKLTFEATPRIGVAYAGPDALKPWRFVIPPQRALPVVQEAFYALKPQV